MNISPDTRRQSLVQLLRESTRPLAAQFLASHLGVSRQVIVSDVAILRERGFVIQSTPRGYILSEEKASPFEEILTCRHAAQDIDKEFYAVVDAGGAVADIQIDHPVYGRISMPLDIRSRLDADRFLSDMSSKEGLPLSLLTDGVHTHKICAPSAEILEIIRTALFQNGILVS